MFSAYSFINAIILGETSDLSDDMYADYGRLGITHIISVSGLHFTIIIMSILREIANERLVVMVTHEKELAYAYSDRILEIRLEGSFTGSDSNPLDYINGMYS